MARMSREARARRYLEASMEAGFTGLPAENRRSREELMAAHERAYPEVREHALVGTNRDFDEPLSAGAREHQRELRRREGLKEGQVQEMRKQLRAPSSTRRPSLEVITGPASSAAAAGQRAVGATGLTRGGGNVVLQLIGVGLLLSLVYLLVAGKGVKALGGIASTVSGGVRAFVAPVDPIKRLETALGAGEVTSSSAPAPSSSAPADPLAGVTGSAEGSPLAGVTGSSGSAGPGHKFAPPPKKAASLTWDSLRREIKAHKLTTAQVAADLAILYP